MRVNKDMLQNNVREYEIKKEEELKKEIEMKQINAKKNYEDFLVNEEDNLKWVENQMIKASQRGETKYTTMVIEDWKLPYSKVEMYQKYFEELGFTVKTKLAYQTKSSIFDLCETVLGYNVEIKW